MNTILASMRQALGKKKAVIFWGLVTLISQVTILLILAPLDLFTILRLQWESNPTAFVSMLTSWQDQGLLKTYQLHFYPDMLHPLWYGLFMLASMSYVFRRYDIDARCNAFFFFAVAAALLDLCENALHLWILADMSASTTLAPFAAFASIAKWLCVTIAISVPVFIVLRSRIPKEDMS